MSTHARALAQMKKMLLNLDAWIGKAAAHAEAKKFDPQVLFAARLAPDQFAFGKQVQAACDAAKAAAARLSGQEPPAHPDVETTLPEVRARIATVVAYLESVPASAYDGADEREIRLPFAPGTVISGVDYLHEMAVPNFYFHLVTAYAILRHNGVDLGKPDYIGGLSLRPA